MLLLLNVVIVIVVAINLPKGAHNCGNAMVDAELELIDT